MEEKKEERAGKTEEKRREMISALCCQDPSRARHGPSSQTHEAVETRWADACGSGRGCQARSSKQQWCLPHGTASGYSPASLVGYLEGEEASSTPTHW